MYIYIYTGIVFHSSLLSTSMLKASDSAKVRNASAYCGPLVCLEESLGPESTSRVSIRCIYIYMVRSSRVRAHTKGDCSGF